MYVTLTLSRDPEAYIYSNLQSLSRELQRRLGYSFDGLLVRKKVRDYHRAVLDIVTGKGHRPSVNRDALADLANRYIDGEDIMFGYLIDHADGISHTFTNGWLQIRGA
jgi:hypothetical protein